MAKPSDRVNPLKFESAAEGGDAADDNMGMPARLNPKEDAVAVAGIYAGESGKDGSDKIVVLYREGDKWYFEDIENAGGSRVSLTNLVGGGATYPPGYVSGVETVWQSHTQVKIEEGAVRDSTNGYNIDVASVLTATITAGGVNGLDTGSEVSNVWYALYVIADSSGTNPVASLLSRSFTAPTVPSGYDVYRRVGAVKNNTFSNFSGFFLSKGPGRDRRIWYIEYPSGVATQLTNGRATAWTDVDCSESVPPSGTEISFMISYLSNVSSANVLYLKQRGALAPNWQCRPANVSSVSKLLTTPLLPCDNSQFIQYVLNGAGSSSHQVTYLRVVGYLEHI